MVRAQLRLVPIVLAVAVLAAACSSGADAPSGTATEIADQVFVEAGVEPFGNTISLETDQEIEYFLGSTNYPDFTDSAVVEPMIGLDARILYILIAESEKDAADIVVQLEEDVDPARLICVTFTLDDVVIDSRGNVVFMTINSDLAQREALAEAFTTIE